MEQPPVLPDLSLLRRIGGGSYGDVWLARTITGVYRAVKVVNKARFADERPFLRELDGITRFQRSVGDQPRQLALMHVARLEAQGIFYYVMELADDVEAGTEIDPEKYEPLTLKALHERRPVLPAAEVIRIGSELARSLQGLHAAGLIHRDVKPSNIIFVAGVPKLADIGLVSSSDHTLTSLGTPGYSPPEGAGTLRADIYSLGKILYQLATGLNTDEFPRLPPNVRERDDVRALLELNEVFLKACQPNPQDRYASAQEMLDDLMLLHAGRSVRELQAVRERLRRLGRAALWLGAAAAVVIAVLGVKNFFAARALAAQEQRARIQAEADERLARYTSDLHLAQVALHDGDLGIARTALRRQAPEAGQVDLRGLEWHALWHESAGDDTRTFGEVGGRAVRQIALSPDGRILASQTGDGERETVLWNLQDGTHRTLAAGARRLGGFSPDGRRLFVGAPDRAIAVFDVDSGDLASRHPTPGHLIYASADGRVGVLGELLERTYRRRFWDLAAQQETGVFEAEMRTTSVRPQASAIDADGRRFAASSFWREGPVDRAELVLWSVAENRILWRQGDEALADAMAFSPDGRWLAVAGAKASIRVYDTDTGQIAMQFPGHLRNVPAVAFSPDASLLASGGGDGIIHIWSMADGSRLESLRGHESSVSRLVWTGKPGELLSASDDGTVRLWQVPIRPTARHVAGLWTQILGDFVFDVNRDRVLATGADGVVVAIDARSLAIDGRLEGLFQPLAIVDGGTTLLALSTDLAVVRRDLRDGRTEPTAFRVAPEARLQEIAVSPDGRRIVLADDQDRLTFCDLASGQAIVRADDATSGVYELAFSADGETVVAGTRSGSLAVWRFQGAEPVRTIPIGRGAVTGLAIAPDGHSAMAGFAGGVMVGVDLEDGRIVRELRAHSGMVKSITWTPDGARLLSAGDDGYVIVWEATEFRRLALLPVRESTEEAMDRGLFKVRVSPDERLLGGFSEGGLLRLWRLER